jgi:uncharacterized protein (TIGR02266 family)
MPKAKKAATQKKKTNTKSKATATKKAPYVKVQSKASKAAERRRAVRAEAGALKVKVDCRDVDVFVSSKIMNISRTGLLLKTRNPPPKNTPLDIEFMLPAGQEPVHATGTVVWISPQASQGNATMPVGVGIRFDDMRANDLKKIEEFIHQSEKSDRF